MARKTEAVILQCCEGLDPFTVLYSVFLVGHLVFGLLLEGSLGGPLGGDYI